MVVTFDYLREIGPGVEVVVTFDYLREIGPGVEVVVTFDYRLHDYLTMIVNFQLTLEQDF